MYSYILSRAKRIYVLLKKYSNNNNKIKKYTHVIHIRVSSVPKSGIWLHHGFIECFFDYFFFFFFYFIFFFIFERFYGSVYLFCLSSDFIVKQTIFSHVELQKYGGGEGGVKKAVRTQEREKLNVEGHMLSPDTKDKIRRPFATLHLNKLM